MNLNSFVMDLSCREVTNAQHPIFQSKLDWRQSVKHLEETISSVSDQSDAINDYYNCLIECDDDQSNLKDL